jgi:hypothetical protein
MRFHFLSHKFGRLLLPWLIVVFFSAAACVPASWFRTVILTGGAVWLLLALSNDLISPASALKRLTSPARTFLVMNVAAMASVAVFVIPATSLWTPTRVNHPAVPK